LRNRATGCFQAQSAADPVEGPGAKHLLEFAEAAGNRRLRDVEALRSDENAFRPGDFDKGADMAQTQVVSQVIIH
jgi:hypothetical protein